jgi:hypothetical protein
MLFPVVAKPDAGLVGGRDGEYVVLGTFVHTLEDRGVGDNAARVEILEAVKDDVAAVRCDPEVRVTRVDGP